MKPATLSIARTWSNTSKRFALTCCACILLLFVLCAPALHAQASAGVTGTVVDSTGALVVGATVTITNEATRVSDTTKTNSSGTYNFTGVNPGTYDVTTAATGFKQVVQNGVHVEVSTAATVNATLTPGATTDVVSVAANAIALNTTQPQLGTTVESELVRSVPVEVQGRGRQIDALQFLSPGTTGSTFSHRVSGGVDFSQEIVYNGVPFPQPETEGYTTNVNPPYESIQEIRVERSTFSAQFGLGQGALTYQFAGGTNALHGSAFYIQRNSAFDSVGFFNGKSQGGTGRQPVDHENNYGFAIGGPVVIPKVYNGHDRTFFHYTQEFFKQNNQNTNLSTVPTALEKTGDFSDFVDGSTGALIPIFDPTTGQQFQYNGKLNVIPPSRISPLSASLIPFIPDPDRPGGGVGGLDRNKTFAPFIVPNIQHVFAYTIDHNLTKAQSLRFTQWRDSFSTVSFDYSPLVVAPNPLNSQKQEPAVGSGFILNYSNTLSPSLVATAGIGWFGEINNQFNNTNYNFAGVQGGVIFPNITFDGQHTPTNYGTSGAWLRSINRKLGIAVVNNYLWSKGRNTFNLGVEYRRAYQDDNEEQTAGGRFNFSQKTTSTADPNDPNFNVDGSAFASFLLGQVDSANRSNSQELRLRNFDLSPYIQDDIKLSPKLTVNLGLRWDIQGPFTENNNLVVFFDPTRANPAAGGLPGAATKLGTRPGEAGYNRADIHYGHFGPRVGFAYQIDNKTVVQAGFSIAFLDGGAYEYGTSKVAVNYGNLLVGSFSRNSTATNQAAYGSYDANPLPNPGATPFGPSLGVGTQINDFSRNDGFAPYSQQWNVNVQRELPGNLFGTVSWTGNRVIHLPSQLNKPNQLDPKYLALGSQLGFRFDNGQAQAAGFTLPYPNFLNDFGGSATVAQALTPFPQYSSIFNNFEGSGTAYYQSLQAELDKRFSNGLSFLIGYTLSRQLDNTSSGFSSFTAGGINRYNQKPEYAVSGSDEPNVVKISGTYELPIGPGKQYVNNRRVTGQLAGGWQVGWILDYEAGSAIGVGENGTPFPNGFNRPNRDSSVKLSTASYNKERDYFLGKGPAAQIYNPLGFVRTTQYVLGNAQRNYGELRNPAFYNENVNVRKHFYFGEHLQGILQVDYFNVLNRTQFNGPDNNISDGSFGQATNPGQNNSNRQGQVGFRLEF